MTTAACYRLRDIDLFASGTYRGDEWSPAKVRAIGANVRRLGPGGLNLHVAPGVAKPSVPTGGIGHDENEADLEWLQRTDLPAAGQIHPETVTVVDDPDNPGHVIIRGDLVNIPPETAAKIRSRQYTRGSAELYDEFLDDFGKGYGPAMRRFVILGGEVPQVKRLRPLPLPEPMAAPIVFAELARSRGRTPERVHYLSFAERVVGDPTAAPSRAQLIKAIQAVAPVSQATLETNTDDQLKEWVANLPKPQPTGTAGMDRAAMIAEMVAAGVPQAELDPLDETALKAKYDEWKATQTGAATTAVTDPAVATMGDPAAMTREELIAELTAAGQDAGALESMSDDDLRALYTSLGLGATADAPAVDPAAAAGGAAATFGERGRHPARRPMTVQQVNRFAEQAVRGLRRQVHQARVLKVNQFAEQMVKEGRWFPAQLPVLKGYLLSLDDTTPVHRFSDSAGRTVQGSALERAMAQVAKGPQLIRFGEKVAAGDPADRKAAASAEVRKVEKFSELYGSNLRNAGTDPTKLVATAKRMAETNPDFKAADLIGKGGAEMVG